MSARPAIPDIQREEFERVFRWAVDTRAARAPLIVIPFAFLAALDPTLPRVLVLALGALFLNIFAQIERRRIRRGPYSPAALANNACAMQSVHVAALLTTGGVRSPLTPVMVAAAVAVGVAVGHPARRRFVVLQLVLIVALALAHTLGWVRALSPAWLAPPEGPAAVWTTALLLALFVEGGSRGGVKMRAFFDTILARSADARQDVLRAHRDQAEELTALSGAIAHELKNPLASVKGLAGLLARDLPEGKPAERLSVLRREVDRMQGILEEFLNFSRPAVPLVAEDVDLGALCSDVAALHEGIGREGGRRVVVSGSAIAHVDGRKTKQILINLVQNALDAAPPRTEVTLTVSAGPRVDVDDAGTGLDPALRERVFEAGVTTKPRGSGLGLTIARALARQQGGDLSLTDRAGGGCRATLTLPGVAS